VLYNLLFAFCASVDRFQSGKSRPVERLAFQDACVGSTLHYIGRVTMSQYHMYILRLNVCKCLCGLDSGKMHKLRWIFVVVQKGSAQEFQFVSSSNGMRSYCIEFHAKEINIPVLIKLSP